MRISIFGPLLVNTGEREVRPRDFAGVKSKQLFEILVMERGHTVSKARLVDLLWTERLPQNYLATLETYVSVLRQTLEPGVRPRESLIVTERGGYRLDVSRVTVDLDDFDDLLRQAALADPVQALGLLELAGQIPRGQILEDEPYADWAEKARASYNVRHVQSLIDAGRLSLLTGQPNAALRYAQEAVAINPLAEAAYQVLMKAAYATRRQEEALQAFDRCRRVLSDELGVDPLDETVAIHMSILRHEDAAGMVPRQLSARDQRTESAETRQPQSAKEPQTQAMAVGEGALPLLGRRPELQSLEEAARRALAGKFSVLLVVGEPGIGKTRLVEALAARLNVRAGFNSCSDLESQLPYAALSLALRPVLATASADTVPLLADLLRRSAAAQPFDEFARLATMESLAAELSEAEPFLLVLDDAEWADDETITTLGYLRRRSPTTPVVVVLTCSRIALRREALRKLAVDLRVDLDVLTPRELAPLEDPDVFGVTGGHPTFVAAWHEARQRKLTDVFPAALRDRTINRCLELGPKAYRLLTVSAVIDPPAGPSLLAELLGTSLDDITRELDNLVEHNLMTGDIDGFRFRHAPEREILAETMSPVRRELFCRRARALLEGPPQRRSTDVASSRLAQPVPIGTADTNRRLQVSLH